MTWPDAKIKTFLYEDTNNPWALTGIIDENSSRFATWTYAPTGQALSSEHAGGVDKGIVEYAAGMPSTPTIREEVRGTYLCRFHEIVSVPTVDLVDASGKVTRAVIDSSLGYPKLAGLSQPAGSGCAASNNATSFDAKGNITSQDNFQGERTCYAYDGQNREVTRVEGLANTVTCAGVITTGSSLPSGARMITTTWHPDWKLPVTVTEPGSVSTTVYNGRPDPFNGNAIASCTTAANLPNGKPLPVACKQVSQATIDANGSQGVTVAIDSSVPQQGKAYSYNAQGRILTSKDGLDRTTTYAYYPSAVLTDFVNTPGSYAPFFDNVSLLIHGDGADGATVVSDSGADQNIIKSFGQTRLSAAQSKFGGTSLSLNGIASYLEFPATPGLNLGSADFTIEGFIQLNSLPAPGAVQTIVGRYETPSDLSWIFYVYNNAGDYRLVLDNSVNGSSGATAVSASFVPVALTWYHVAVVRNAGVAKIFINGVQVASTPFTSSIYTSSVAKPTRVGAWLNSSMRDFFNGFIDELRITKGLARYTASFTPPTAPFKA